MLRVGGRCLFTDPVVVTGLVSNAELAARSSIGYFVFAVPGADDALLRETGFEVERATDATAAVAETSRRWRAAREERRAELVSLETEAKYEAIQQFQQSHKNPQRRIRSLYYLALCFKAKSQFDIASQQLEKARSELQLMDDTKKDILYELGTVYEAMGDAAKAVDLFKEIYSVDIGYRDVDDKIEKHYKK